jgi:putative NADH-flavin reductase
VRIAVLGANGPTGRQVVSQALASGHQVIAVTCNPAEFPLYGPLLDVASDDVMHPVGIERILAGADAVISTCGVPYSRKPISVYSVSMANIVHAMNVHSIERIVCVSSTTVATADAPGDSLIWRRAFQPVLRGFFGRTLYDDMQLMEEIVQRSSLDWTIVRPGGLFNTPAPTLDYEVSTKRLRGRITSRADLADTLIKEATQPQHSRAIVEVITRSQTPRFAMFLKEPSTAPANARNRRHGSGFSISGPHPPPLPK